MLSKKKFPWLAVMSLAATTAVTHAAPIATLFVSPTDVIDGTTVDTVVSGTFFSINEADVITFVSGAPGVNAYGGTVGDLQLLASVGVSSPGQIPGWISNRVGAPIATDPGYFLSIREKNNNIMTLQTAEVLALVDATTGALTTVHRNGMNGPGTTIPFSYANWKVNKPGQVVLQGTYATNTGQATSLNNNVIFGGSPGSLSVILRQGDQVPGLPAGTQWGTPGTIPLAFGPSGFNDNGIFAGSIRLQNFLGTSLGNAIFQANVNTGVTNVLAKDGDAAPGGGTFSSLSSTNLNVFVGSDNSTAFAGTVQNPDTTLSRGIFVNTASGTQRWLLNGDVVADINKTISPTSQNLRRIQDLVSGGRLLGDAVMTDSSEAMLFGVVGDIHTIAVTGDTAPGLATGVSIKNFGVAQIAQANDAGQVEFQATLQGTGITSANDKAWFAYLPGSGLQLLFQESGSLLASAGLNYAVPDNSVDVDPGSALDNNGNFVFSISGRGFEINFNTLSAVPEPASLGLLASGVATLLIKPRRRR